MHIILFFLICLVSPQAWSHGHGKDGAGKSSHHTSHEEPVQSFDQPSVEVLSPQTRLGQKGHNTAAYMTIRNMGDQPLSIVQAETPVAAKVLFHTTEKDNQGISRMREMKSLEISANDHLELKTGQHHLMLINLQRSVLEGEHVPVTLIFASGEQITVQCSAQRCCKKCH